ncbi:MAG: heme biosynthesis HemY N-terminal domain-containing protein [Gammaproteobacteria bacterium]
MRLLIGLLIALFLGVLLALGLQSDPGFVLIGFQYWTIETSLGLAAIVLLVTFAASYVVVRMIAHTLGFPALVKAWAQRRRVRHAHKLLSQGLIALAEGRWEVAEKRLSKCSGMCEVPLINYLGAARAAQKRGDHDARDRYLRQAHHSAPEAELAVGLTQAELQLSHKQLEQALATLSHLRSIAPRHAYVLRLLMKLYRQLGDWTQLSQMLPELKKRKVVTAEEVRDLSLDIYSHTLERAGDDAEEVAKAWDALPRALRQETRLLIDYVQRLHALGDDVGAEKLIREHMKREWSDELAWWYGVVRIEDAPEQLRRAEQWIAGHERNPMLLLTLGRLCRRARLWGKARSYLEASLGAGQKAETYRELGDLLDELGETGEAARMYREGLKVAVGPSPVDEELLVTTQPRRLPEGQRDMPLHLPPVLGAGLAPK